MLQPERKRRRMYCASHEAFVPDSRLKLTDAFLNRIHVSLHTIQLSWAKNNISFFYSELALACHSSRVASRCCACIPPLIIGSLLCRLRHYMSLVIAVRSSKEMQKSNYTCTDSGTPTSSLSSTVLMCRHLLQPCVDHRFGSSPSCSYMQPSSEQRLLSLAELPTLIPPSPSSTT